MRLMVDTGSSDFWVHGTKAPNPKGGKGVEIVKGQTFNIDYQNKPGAFIRGPVVSTKVRIGNVSVSNMSVGVATTMGFSYPLDGFVGLGFKGLNSVRPTQQRTFMMAAQSQLQQPVFTLSLKSSAKGEISFGSIDKKQYKGDLMTSPVKDENYWLVDKVTLVSGKVKITQKMLFDSGGGPTTYAAEEFVDDYWAQVDGSQSVILPPLTGGTWLYPCAVRLPEIKVSIGYGKTPVTIPGSKLNAGEFGPQAKGGKQYLCLSNGLFIFLPAAFILYVALAFGRLCCFVSWRPLAVQTLSFM
ncbi:MAG: hypothetical protein Q9213_004971 [Squamulea squamosa]